MIDIYGDDSDDWGFLTEVEHITNGAAITYSPREVHLVSVRGWFDHKWLKFSGTVMHEIGVWMHDTTLPPFHPNRIEAQRYYCWNEAEQSYKREERPTQLHIYQASDKNLKRKISAVSDSALFAWYTGNTKQTGKGSLMIYLHTADHKTAWFISFDKKNDWQSRQLKSLSPMELNHLEDAGKQVVEATKHTTEA